MTPQQIEAMKMALDLATMHHTDDGYAALRAKVRSASKEALAQPEQEPVAWMSSGEARMIHWKSKHPGFGDDWIPLYTTPPQRKPLTDEEADEFVRRFARYELIRAIEAAHGIKENT